MQRQHGLLTFGLHGNRFPRLLHRKPDCTRIGRVAFVADIEGFDESGRHQLHLVTHLRKLSRPVVRSATCLHADQTRFSVNEMFEELCSLDTFADDLTGIRVDPVHLMIYTFYRVFGWGMGQITGYMVSDPLWTSTQRDCERGA
jgi:hypothetical protein